MRRWLVLVGVVVVVWGLSGCKLGTLGGDLSPSDGPLTAPVMMTVSAGTFTMGRLYAADAEVQRSATYEMETPTHEVTLTRYEIGVFEVTNRRFAAGLNWALARDRLEGATGAAYEGGTPYVGGQVVCHLGAGVDYVGDAFVVSERSGQSLAEHPATYVTWYGAAAYCNWLSESRGLTSCYSASWGRVSLAGYRLPTEAEWERAAAWEPPVTAWRYGFRDDLISASRCTYGDNDPLGLLTTPVGWYDGSGATVDGSSPAGCYDMSGNAFEWCQDWLGDYAAEAVTDPVGPATGTAKVVRGGSYASGSEWCRSAARYDGYGASSASVQVGFRVARTTGS